MTPKRLLASCLAVAAAGFVLAACGSSKAPGIQLAPSSGATQAAIPPTPKVPAQLAKKPIVTVPSGPAPKTLVTKDLIVGTGKAATAGSTITVNYIGVLYKTGKQFDSSWSRNQLFTTPLSTSSVIPGWVKGIAGMKVGGRRELIIPPSLGYGAAGSGSTIPPTSTLVFVVDLIAVS
jgi:peptidylprolyl isomerase